MLMNTTDITERGLELLIASDLSSTEQITNKELFDGAPVWGCICLEILRINRDHAWILQSCLSF